jgi:hypothetical protein
MKHQAVPSMHWFSICGFSCLRLQLSAAAVVCGFSCLWLQSSAASVVCGFSCLRFPVAPQKLENYRNKHFVSFETPAKLERVVTCWNPAAQTHPVLDSSAFAPVLKPPHRTCLQSAPSVLTTPINCHVIALFVFRKPLFIKLYRIYVCYTHIT